MDDGLRDYLRNDIVKAGSTQREKFTWSGYHLKMVQSDFATLATLKHLDLSNNDLKAFPPKACKGLKSLEVLNLAKNQMSTMSGEIAFLTALRSLNIACNRILFPLPESLCELANLEALNIRGNGLRSLPSRIGKLTKLLRFDARDNKLGGLPDSFGKLTALRKLQLCNNVLDALPDSFGGLDDLRVLRANRNKIKCLPASFGDMARLEDLHLCFNELSALPDTFGDLQSLKRCMLNNNKLTALPESIGKLASLRSVVLYNNQLISLPATLAKLTTLVEIDLRWNWRGLAALTPDQGTAVSALLDAGVAVRMDRNLDPLFALFEMNCSEEVLFDVPPVVLERAATLRKLNLSRNSIDQLHPPALLGALTALRVLDLHSNRLAVLPDSIASLAHLKLLDVSCNLLTKLPDAIGELAHLATLACSRNRLRTLPAAIGNLRALTSLDVRLNRLVALPAELGTLDGLRSLDVRINRLRRLPSTVRGLTSLTRLRLAGNDIVIPPEIGFLVSLQEIELDLNATVTAETEAALTSLSMASGLVVKRDKPAAAAPLERGGGGALLSHTAGARLRRMQTRAQQKSFASNFAFSTTQTAQSPAALRQQVWAARNASSRRRLAPRLANKRGPAEALASILLPRSKAATSSAMLTATRPRSCAALGIDPETGRPSRGVLNDVPAWRYTKPPEFKLADFQTHQVVDTLEDVTQPT